jgi:hypothetical protein
LVVAAVVVVFGFHALVTPVASSTGAWIRSLVAFVPVLIIAALEVAASIPRWAVLRIAAITLVVVAASAPLGWAHGVSEGVVARHNAMGVKVARLLPLLSASAPSGRPVVVMTRNPWELTEVTGIPAVQIPNNDLCTILGTARRYGVTTVVLPAHRTALQGRATLKAAGFRFLGRQDSRGVYRLPATSPACKPG